MKTGHRGVRCVTNLEQPTDNYSPDQPRDERGRFAEGDGGGGSGDKKTEAEMRKKGEKNYQGLSAAEKKQYNADWKAAKSASHAAHVDPSKETHKAAAKAHMRASKSAPSHSLRTAHRQQAYQHGEHAGRYEGEAKKGKGGASEHGSGGPSGKQGPIEKTARAGGPASAADRAKAKKFADKSKPKGMKFQGMKGDLASFKGQNVGI